MTDSRSRYAEKLATLTIAAVVFVLMALGALAFWGGVMPSQMWGVMFIGFCIGIQIGRIWGHSWAHTKYQLQADAWAKELWHLGVSKDITTAASRKSRGE